MLTIDPALFRPDAVSPEVAAFNRALEAELAEAPAMHELEPAIVRQAREEGKGVVPSGGPLEGSAYREVPTPLGRVRVTLPEGRPEGVFIHIHGGGWTIGAPHLTDGWCQYVAQEARAAVVSVPYRLAPENPWPACADDVEAGALWAIDHAVEAFGTDRVAIGGESAGAHLAAVALLRLRAQGRAGAIAGALLHYGVFDLGLTPSAACWGARNMILSTPTIAWFQENLTGPGAALRDPALSPLYADLSDMPSALFQCGDEDPLIDDTLMMAARWAGAGAGAEAKIYPGGVHAFDMFPTTQAAEARAAGARFLRSVFTGRS